MCERLLESPKNTVWSRILMTSCVPFLFTVDALEAMRLKDFPGGRPPGGPRGRGSEKKRGAPQGQPSIFWMKYPSLDMASETGSGAPCEWQNWHSSVVT